MADACVASLRSPGGVLRRWSRPLGLLSLAALLGAAPALAATLPGGFSEALVAGGLNAATAMALAPDGRIFVCEQTGALRVIENGTLLATPFVTLSVDSAGERGLLGVAFDPAFETNHHLYVYYTVPVAPEHNRVSRFTANGNVAVAGSEVVILELDSLSTATNHNGGGIHFGPDGRLYVGVGENANSANSQTLANRLGKVLRINSDGTIPTDNPFYSRASGANRSIWAMGLRNPFTFAFERGSGRLFIDDVGQSTWEEINNGIAGANYGWPNEEGPPAGTPNPAFTYPIFYYGHGSGSDLGCAITGGAFYDPLTVTFPGDYASKYFFADLCGGWIRLFDPATGTAADFASGINQPVDLRVSPAGDLYYLARGSGEVWRVSYPAPTTQASIPRYRLYNDVTKEHLYTTDANEYAVLGTRGWVQEGVAHHVYQTSATVSGLTPVSLYRLYHAGIRQHLWTTDLYEYLVLGSRGWTPEGADGYVLTSPVAGLTVPLYRLRHAVLPLHLWTVDRNEYDVLATRGWIQEGVAGDVVP